MAQFVLAIWRLLWLMLHISLTAVLVRGDATAWWTAKGVAVAWQIPGKPDIAYSPCNTNGVHFPSDGRTLVLETRDGPKLKTHIAATGWLDSRNRLWVCCRASSWMNVIYIDLVVICFLPI